MPSSYWQRAATLTIDSAPIVDARGHMNPELPRRLDAGPGYDRERALELVQARYQNVPQIIPITMERALGDRQVRRTLSQLRASGWLDWHLLTALANISINYREAYQKVVLKK